MRTIKRNSTVQGKGVHTYIFLQRSNNSFCRLRFGTAIRNRKRVVNFNRIDCFCEQKHNKKRHFGRRVGVCSGRVNKTQYIVREICTSRNKTVQIIVYIFICYIITYYRNNIVHKSTINVITQIQRNSTIPQSNYSVLYVSA